MIEIDKKKLIKIRKELKMFADSIEKAVDLEYKKKQNYKTKLTIKGMNAKKRDVDKLIDYIKGIEK